MAKAFRAGQGQKEEQTSRGGGGVRVGLGLGKSTACSSVAASLRRCFPLSVVPLSLLLFVSLSLSWVERGYRTNLTAGVTPMNGVILRKILWAGEAPLKLVSEHWNVRNFKRIGLFLLKGVSVGSDSLGEPSLPSSRWLYKQGLTIITGYGIHNATKIHQAPILILDLYPALLFCFVYRCTSTYSI